MKASLMVRPETNPNLPEFTPGDTIRVNFRIREGERERVQAFQGVVIRRQNGSGVSANFTVRRITAGIGIERTFPLHSPLLESLEVTRHGSVRRAKLFYLRELQGRAARIKEGTSKRLQRQGAQVAAFPEPETVDEETAAPDASEDKVQG